MNVFWFVCFVYNLSSEYQTINIPNLTYKITEKEKLKSNLGRTDVYKKFCPGLITTKEKMI